MVAVKSAGEAIKIAKDVIKDAGYDKIQIRNADYDEDEEIWTLDADADEDTVITITIDARTGEVTEFNSG